ncbi:ash family protein, partial [Salmonella enterica]|nr:ash family protein [Salmonella enterica]
MTTYKNRLPPSALMGYISPAPHKTGAGIETLLITLAHNRASGFFTCDALPHFRIMVGRTGQPSGWPGSSVTGSLNPVRLTTPSLRPLGGELSQLTLEAPSWPTANSAVPTLTFSASIRKPKSTADCIAPAISPSSCRSTCCTKSARHSCRLTSPPSSAIWLTTCASCNTSPAPAGNPSTRPGSSGAFVHPVNGM